MPFAEKTVTKNHFFSSSSSNDRPATEETEMQPLNPAQQPAQAPQPAPQAESPKFSTLYYHMMYK